MDLGEVLKTYLNGTQQGQLVLKFVDENHLGKISIVAGQAVYLTLGTLGPDETLRTMAGKDLEWHNFIEGMPARKQLDHPLNEQLFNLAGATPLAQPAPASLKATSLTKDIPPEDKIESSRIQQVIDQFIDLVGPLGTIIAEKICADLSCHKGASMNTMTYSRFIAALTAEVPENERQTFIDAMAD